MKKQIAGAVMALLATVAAGNASAARFAYRFTMAQADFGGVVPANPDTYTVSGVLTADATSPFTYDITGATGTFSSSFNADLDSVAGVGPSFPFGIGPSFVLFDDVLLGFSGGFFGDRFQSVDYSFLGGFGVAGAVGGPITFASVTPLAAGVPEPATWALMILGMGAVGGAMRRRRTAVRFAAA